MKKFYDKHFRVKENEKIREHVMMMRIVLAVAVVCVSMCSMGITAYAFFTYTVTSSSNVIKAASYWTNKSAVEYGTDGSVVATISDDDGYLVLKNNSTEIHTFDLTLKAAGTASVGYARIEVVTYDGESVYSSETFYTEPIRKDVHTGSNGYVIHIVVPAGELATVQVTDNWGSCARKAILASGTVLEPPFPERIVEPPVIEEPIVETPAQDDEAAVGEGTGENAGSGDDSDNPSVDDSKKEESQDGDKGSEDGDNSSDDEPEGTPDETSDEKSNEDSEKTLVEEISE